MIVTDVGGPSTGGPEYTYVAVPSVESITPTQGATAGGTSVKIKGTGFVLARHGQDRQRRDLGGSGL